MWMEIELEKFEGLVPCEELCVVLFKRLELCQSTKTNSAERNERGIKLHVCGKYME